MKAATAQLPRDGGQDRIYATEYAVILLDGASAFKPVAVSPEQYVQVLGKHLVARINQVSELQVILREAIAETAGELDLTPGSSPSSTVAIVREIDDSVECLVLGDSLIVLPGEQVTDERLSQVATDQRELYRERLRDGSGYDDEHRRTLRKLQAEEVRHRNNPGGYWIAEAQPKAADHAITMHRPLQAAPWALLASDGAFKPMIHLGLADWASLRTADDQELEQILTECQRWESEDDPSGVEYPRAKQHDDKTLAVTSFSTVSRAHLTARRTPVGGDRRQRKKQL